MTPYVSEALLGLLPEPAKDEMVAIAKELRLVLSFVEPGGDAMRGDFVVGAAVVWCVRELWKLRTR